MWVKLRSLNFAVPQGMNREGRHARDVRYWHLADIARVSISVRLLGQSRHARDACLIHVIVEPSLLLKNITKERATMPTETLILVVVISAIFAVFAGALAWADFYTRGLRKS